MRLIALTLFALLSGQAVPAELVGNWIAEHDGVTFARLELRSQDGVVTGGMSIGSVSFDKAGGLRTVAVAPPTMTPLARVSHSGHAVSFTWLKDSEEDRFRFQLTAAGVGELELLLPEVALAELKAEGVPSPRPIVLRKVMRP